MANKISVLLDVTTDKAVGAIGKFKSALADADTNGTSKFKAGASAAFDSVKANAGALAAAGGAALAAFAVKGVADFQDLGIAVGQFTDATGASAEEASRLIEVAGDLGVEQSALESAIGRMNKTAGATPDVFRKLGVEIAKTADGATSTNETFLNAVEALNKIKDPAAKAAAGAQLFGRGWQQMAEVIGRGSDQLRTDLAAVSDAKVFDDEKVKDARSLREAFDAITDAVQDLFLQIGTALAPVIADLAPLLGDVIKEAGPLVEILGKGMSAALKVVGPVLEGVLAVLGPLIEGLSKFVGMVEEAVDFLNPFNTTLDNTSDYLARAAEAHFAAAEAAEELTDATDDGTARQEYYASRVAASSDELLQQQQAAQKARDEHQRLAEKVDQGRDALSRYRGELDLLQGNLGEQEAWLRLGQSIDDAVANIGSIQEAYENGTISAEENMRQQALEWINLKQQAIDYGTAVGLTPKEITTLVKLIDNGEIDEYERQLTILTRNRQINLDIIARGGAGYTVRVAPDGGVPRFDAGGVMPGPRGQHNLALVAGGETILPTHKGNVGLGGNTYNITVTSADPGQIIQLIKEYERRNGSGWRR